MLAAMCCVRSWNAEGFNKVKKQQSKCDSVANITRLLRQLVEDIITASSRPPSDRAPSPLQKTTSTSSLTTLFADSTLSKVESTSREDTQSIIKVEYN